MEQENDCYYSGYNDALDDVIHEMIWTDEFDLNQIFEIVEKLRKGSRYED